MDALILFLTCLVMNLINAYLGYRIGKRQAQPTYSKGIYQGKKK